MAKDNRIVAEILGVVAAAGIAAVFIKHETGSTPFLKTKKQLWGVVIGAAILSALAMTKAVNDISKKCTKFMVLGFVSGALVVGGLLVSAKRTQTKYLTSGGGPDVFKAQLGLLKLGYHVEPSGHMDAATTEALKGFQATYGLLTTDGTLTPETGAYIEQAVAQMRVAPPFSPDTGYHPQSSLQT